MNLIAFDIRLLIPAIDTELVRLATYKTLLERNGISAVISFEDFIKKCKSKWLVFLYP